MRYLITFSYDGSKYGGYQKQLNISTVQSKVEESLKKINGDKYVSLVASGRTDRGVHALGQMAHFDLDVNITKEKLKLALNSMLPPDIYIKDVEEVSNSFHARFDVKSKEYIYKINLGEYNPLEKDYIYQYSKKLDIEAMKKAITYFVGMHNFKSFAAADDVRDNYERYIMSTDITLEDDIMTIKFVGSGFLRYMVRNMVGLLIEIGEGKKDASDVIKILEKEDRKEAGIKAPACGLYLNKVNY